MEIGARLKRIRQQRGLTQEELADRCELSKGFISQVERDLTSPSISTLQDLLECLGVPLETFFAEANEKVVYEPQDLFVKEDPAEGRVITWLVPNAQKNSMEPILLKLAPGGVSQTLPPTEGEEFGYILKGTAVLHVGDEKRILRRGTSFCLHPDAPHYLENNTQKETEILWVSDPPCF